MTNKFFNKLITIVLTITLFLTVVGCGDSKVISGKEYETYGLLNEKTKEDPRVEYEIIWGNIFWGVVLFETIIAPIYFFGFSLFEPVGEKSIPTYER